MTEYLGVQTSSTFNFYNELVVNLCVVLHCGFSLSLVVYAREIVSRCFTRHMSQAFHIFLKKLSFDFPPHWTSTSSQLLHMNCSSSNMGEQEQQTALEASPEFSSHSLCFPHLYQKYLPSTFYNRYLSSPVLIRLVELSCNPITAF